MTSSTTPQHPPPSRPLQFPPSPHPRTWLLTSGASPLGLQLSRALLAHGDKIILGTMPGENRLESNGYSFAAGTGLTAGSTSPRRQDLELFIQECHQHDEDNDDDDWISRVKIVECDTSHINQCQAAIASAVSAFGGLDVLVCCHSEAVFGTIEELSSSPDSQMLIRQQMKTNFFGPVNMIRAAVPVMRGLGGGHIVVVTGITSHLGTPGLPIFCAAGWGLEGFCDSLAYEIAPFNIKMSIVQPSAEIAILPNRILSAPQLPHYGSTEHPAPLARSIFARMLDRLDVTAPPDSDGEKPSLLSHKKTIIDPVLPSEFLTPLLAETLFAICAIGGHDNPPARHVIGMEGMAAVKEKLKTTSEELEDFLSASAAADMDDIAPRKGSEFKHSPVPAGG